MRQELKLSLRNNFKLSPKWMTKFHKVWCKLELVQYLCSMYMTHTFGVLMCSCDVRCQAAGHQHNDAQLIVKLVDHFVPIEHVRRSLNVSVVLWSLTYTIHIFTQATHAFSISACL